nr:MAG TPA: hypothetical protein [Caudoviricetes sp.]
MNYIISKEDLEFLLTCGKYRDVLIGLAAKNRIKEPIPTVKEINEIPDFYKDLETYMNNKTKPSTDKIEKLEEELECVRDKKRPEGCPYCLRYDWIDQKEVQKTSVEMEKEYGEYMNYCHRCGRKLK